jgi:23S rRNA (cytidine1920-2'-O)/16S rRNA (cytidine1409-2'-O)-methyltransferase
MAKAPKTRADALLAARGLAETRTRAQALILAGKVWQGTERVDKPGRLLPADCNLRVDEPPRFVGRGGEKLEAFLEAFPLDVSGLDILDVGASTGGFTDCLLQRGAASATCVDVGRAQLAEKLRRDPRVTNLEQTNARFLEPKQLPCASYPLIVMDLSFISLRKIWPAVWPVCAPGGHLIALVKPQFEASKAEADAGRGIIRDDAIRTRILEDLKAFAIRELSDCAIFGTLACPVHGADGNREYLLGLRKTTFA